MRPAALVSLTVSAVVLTACAEVEWSVTPQASGVTTSLRGLSVVDDHIVWIGAPDGQALRTLDGGATWQVLAIDQADGADLRSAHGFDADHAVFITAGQPARIIETRDGGENFRTLWEDETGDAFFDSLAFWDGDRGLAFSDPVAGTFLILRTLDGGQSWTALPDLPTPLEGEAGFAASNTSIALTTDGCAFVGTGGGPVARLLRSCDFGDTWDFRPTPMASGLPGAGIFSLAVDSDSGVLVAAGGDYQSPQARSGNFALSRDRGDSWQTAGIQPFGYRSGIAGAAGTWFSVGTTGVDMADMSGADITWRRSGWDIPAPNAIAFSPSGQAGWIIGADGGIWRLSPE